MGKQRSTIANTLRLLALPPAVRDMLAAGQLTSGHARAILGLDGEERQLALAGEVAKRGLSVRETEDRVRELRVGEGPVPAPPESERYHSEFTCAAVPWVPTVEPAGKGMAGSPPTPFNGVKIQAPSTSVSSPAVRVPPVWLTT